MKAVGIIAEYNPFHKGHEYHIQKTRQLTGADYVVVVMSGDFVQRGEPAVCNKYLRARMALQGGADAVFELPVIYAAGSSELFASGAVRLLSSFGVIDYLSFGCELGNLEALQSSAHFFANEPEEYRIMLRKLLCSGMSFPSARETAFSEYIDTFSVPSALSKELLIQSISRPNNILALEYLRAIEKIHTLFPDVHTPSPVAVKRTSDNYADTAVSEDGFSSADSIRTLLKQSLSEGEQVIDLNSISGLVPPHVLQLIRENYRYTLPIFRDELSSMLTMKLLSLSASEYSSCHDVNMDLANSIFRQRFKSLLFTERVQALKSKCFTYTGIQRGLIHILLSITKDMASSAIISDKQSAYLPYARLLGMRKSCSPLMRSIQKNSYSDIITKLADADKKKLTPDWCKLLELDIKASHVYKQLILQKYGYHCRTEYEEPVILI